MKDLGFSFGNNSALSIYHDGQGRDDVKAALSAYVQEMLNELHLSVSYTGEDMMTEVEGESLQRDSLASKLVFAFHDECCAHTKDSRKMQWRCIVSGTMQQKDKVRIHASICIFDK